MMNCALIIAILSIILLSFFSYASLGDTYSTSAPPFVSTGVTHPLNPKSNAFWGPGYKRPYPTNTWWINYVLGMLSFVLDKFPFVAFLHRQI